MKSYAVICAADLATVEDIVSLVRSIASSVDGIKIGAAGLFQGGRDFVRRVSESIPEKPLLVDLKIADIGFRSGTRWDGTNAKIVESLEGSGATHVTVHGFPGPYSVAEAVETAREIGIGVLLLPMMSHPGAKLLFGAVIDRHDALEALRTVVDNVGNVEDLPCTDAVDAILMMGEVLGAAGYIGPATEPDVLNRYRKATDRPIWCPGFGRQDRLGRNLDEQLFQWASIVGGESAAIVGSAIFKAPDPKSAAEDIIRTRDRVVERLP